MKRHTKFTGEINIRNKYSRVKTAKGRKSSSTNWLARQLNDPYVKAAKQDGLRSRAAYKLLQLDERFELLRPGIKAIDLGAAPGGWSQVISEIIGSNRKGSSARLIAVDIAEMDPIPGVKFFKRDFMLESTISDLKHALGGYADAVFCDIAPPLSGHRQTDHIRTITIVEAAYSFACTVLGREGNFVAKVFQGGTENTLLNEIKTKFQSVKHAKPPASRADSSELYVVAQGYRRDEP
tara:strand:+ start:91 stop:801 length:711 start_codon:yes stop_codon:yes gene_type:complete